MITRQKFVLINESYDQIISYKYFKICNAVHNYNHQMFVWSVLRNDKNDVIVNQFATCIVVISFLYNQNAHS